MAALAAASAVLVAGCGGGGDPMRTGSGAGRVAAFIPAGSPVYLEMSTDLSSPQWSMARDIATRFPGYGDLMDRARESLQKDGLDFERDIRPILGDDAAVGIIDFARQREAPAYIVAIDLADGKEATLEDLITRGGGTTEVGQYEGATIYRQDNGSSYAAIVDGAFLIAATEADVKRGVDAKRGGASASMAGSDQLKAAFQGLPDEVLIQGFVDIGSLITTVERQAGTTSASKQLESLGFGSDSSIAISLSTEQDGVRIKAVGDNFGKVQEDTSYTPRLVERASADALAVVGISNTYEIGRLALEQAIASDPTTRDQLATIRGALGFIGLSVDDLKMLFSGEQIITVEPGSPVPRIVAGLRVTDGKRAAETLDRVRTQITVLLGSRGGGSVPPFNEVELADGVKGWRAQVDPKADVVYGVDGDLAIIGSDVEAVKRFQRPDSRLTDDPAYQAATDQMPGKVQSLLWLDVSALVDLAEAQGAFKDADPDALPNIRPVKNVAAWSTGGEHPTFEVFFTVK